MVAGEKDVINDDQNDRRAADKIQVMGARRKINVGKGLRFHRRDFRQKRNGAENGESPVVSFYCKGNGGALQRNAERISRKNDRNEKERKKRKTSSANSLKTSRARRKITA
jgi:hypothetical protein